MAGPRGRIGPGSIATARDLAPLIDHTVLGELAGAGDVSRACDEAIEHGFAGVCVREVHLALVVERLGSRGPLPIAVADFPRGAGATAARVEETRRLSGRGAREIDVVFPLPALIARDHAAALRDLEAVVRAAGSAAVKVILETGTLTPVEMGAACALAKAAGASFVKTCTGFGPRGATEDDVALLRSLVGEDTGVKASGGIRTAAAAIAMVRAGANRLGASASVAIVTGSF